MVVCVDMEIMRKVMKLVKVLICQKAWAAVLFSAFFYFACGNDCFMFF